MKYPVKIRHISQLIPIPIIESGNLEGNYGDKDRTNRKLSTPEVVAAGIPALRIYFCLFIPMSLQMAGQGVFVSLGRSKQAVFFSLLRKAIINAPLTVVLHIWMGTTGVFTAEAISQLVGGLACSLTMYFTVYRPLGRLPENI